MVVCQASAPGVTEHSLFLHSYDAKGAKTYLVNQSAWNAALHYLAKDAGTAEHLVKKSHGVMGVG
jgi:hypothetical protein